MPGEKFVTTPLGDGLSIRVYGADLDGSHAFYFDFIDKSGNPIQKPSNIRIYTEPIGFNPVVEVFSITESLMKSTEGALWVRQAQEDWEAKLHGDTFVIPEGTTLRISYSDHVPYLIRIPIWGEGMHSNTSIPSVW